MPFKKLLILSGLSALLFAQPGATPLKADLIKTGLYVIYGPAGNTVLRLTADGLLLVDGQPENCFNALLAKAQRLSMSEQPVRALILTHEDPPRMGSNAALAKQGASIIAQTHLGQHLMPNASLFTFDREYTVRGGGVEVRLLHFGNDPANGNTVVYFPAQKVVAVGDLLRADMPEVDSANRESMLAWAATLREILKLDFDVVVPGQGALATRRDLETFQLRMDERVIRQETTTKIPGPGGKGGGR